MSMTQIRQVSQSKVAVGFFVMVFALSMALQSVPFSASADHDPFGGVPQTQVTICHSTGSGNFVTNNPSINSHSGSPNGHEHHDDDIIPPYHYTDNHDNPGSYPGLNWNSTTEVFWNNGGCNGVASTPTPTPTASPTPTATPTPSVTPTPTPSPSVTPTPTPDPSVSPTPTPSATPTPSSTPEPSVTPTPTPTPSPTVSPTPEPSSEPTPTPEVTNGGGNNGPGLTLTPTPEPGVPLIPGIANTGGNGTVAGASTDSGVVAGAMTELPNTDISLFDQMLLSLFSALMLTGMFMTLIGSRKLPKVVLQRIS